jgi:hypothetical protein
MFAARKLNYSRKMFGLNITDAQILSKIQQPCCVFRGMLTYLRTMSMFMQ